MKNVAPELRIYFAQGSKIALFEPFDDGVKAERISGMFYYYG